MVTIQHALAFVDGSGVEALVDVGGVRFACSFTGEARSVRCLTTRSMSRSERARTSGIASSVFSRLCQGYPVAAVAS